ncbi:MAG: hypothetical protein RIR64_1760 [Bacteroidota bacterium]
MKYKFLFIALFCLYTCIESTAQATNDKEKMAVLDVIKQTFKAMNTVDTVLLRNCFAPGAVLQIIQNQKDSVVVRTRTASEFIVGISKQSTGALDEKTFDENIFIDRELATAWAPYTFHLNGKFSHKGIDSFQFVKMKEGWKIQYLIYNMYQQ